MGGPFDPRNGVGATLADKYQLLRVLGVGGMGVVYEAMNEAIGRRVAVKLLADARMDERARERLLREARSAAALRHPNVVDVLDVAQDAQFGPFLVMELLQGESLESLLARTGPLPIGEVAAVLAPIAEALHEAHGAGVIHRDIKPSNIFLHGHAGRRVPKLVDFGIARAEGSRLTRTGAALGTYGYMAPEQMTNAKASDERSDIWALAVVVYECLTARLPFEGTTQVEIIANILRNGPTPLDRVAPSAPRHVVDAVHQALSQDPRQRPASVAEFAQRLRFDVSRSSAPPQAPAGPLRASAPPPSAPPQGLALPAATPPRRRVPLALGATIGLGAIVGGIGAAWMTSRAAQARRAPSMASAEAPSPRALEFERAAPPLPIAVRPIPAGRATLGSTAGEARAARDECVAESGEANCPVDVFDREAPVTLTPVGSFQLAAHEVTNAELFAWLGQRTPVHLTKDGRGVEWIADDRGPLAAIAGPQAAGSGMAVAGGRVAVRPGFEDRPAVWVSHVGAGRFCADAGMRLPSATEWEWAARGADRRRFPWGNAFFVCRRAVVARDAKLPCSEEGAGPASIVDPMQDRTPEGIDGLGGNVAEWVADAAPSGWQQSGRACGDVGCFVVKGGDWASLPWTARAAAARIAPADFGSGAIGWRCARDGT